MSTGNWDAVNQLLNEAADCLLPGAADRRPAPSLRNPLSGSLEEFKEFLDHNELELAWDTLTEMAECCDVPESFWRKLAEAARLMELPFKEAAIFRWGKLPPDWDIGREGRQWTKEESGRRIYQAPEKIEFVRGIFASDEERLTILGMLLETLGIDRVIRLGKLSDWKAAIADLEKDGHHVE